MVAQAIVSLSQPSSVTLSVNQPRMYAYRRRLRHAINRVCLRAYSVQRDVPIADVADLLGNDEKTVRDHYSRWVPERRAGLTKMLKDAFDDKPRPRLVALPGGRG